MATTWTESNDWSLFASWESLQDGSNLKSVGKYSTINQTYPSPVWKSMLKGMEWLPYEEWLRWRSFSLEERWLRAHIVEVYTTPIRIWWHWGMCSNFGEFGSVLVIPCLRFGLFHSAGVFLALCQRFGLFVLWSCFYHLFSLFSFLSLFLSVIFNPIPLHRAIKAVSAFAPLRKFYQSEERGNPLK